MSFLGGLKALAYGALGFFVGSVAWSFLSGIIGGLLDSLGVLVPASMLLLLSPVVGLIVGVVAVGKVVG